MTYAGRGRYRLLIVGLVSLLGSLQACSTRTVLKPNPQPIYCYSTLGRPDCHPLPLTPQEEQRLKGYYGPPPNAVVPTLDATALTPPPPS